MTKERRFTAVIDFSATVTIFANSLEEAEEEAANIDVTEVLDNISTSTVIHVEEE